MKSIQAPLIASVLILTALNLWATQSKVLYNTSTHQTLTQDQVKAGGTGWVLLDANNSNYASYTHPAYYNTTVHQVLDSSTGGKVGDWILTQASSGGGSSNVTLVEKVSNPNPENYGYFGTFLSKEGDLLVAGSKNADVVSDGNTITDAGKVYVYQVNETNGTAQLKHSFHAPNPVEGDGFGYRVFLKDGKLAIGTPPANLNSFFAGGIDPDYDSGNPRSVFVYKIDANGTATHEQTIAAPDGMTARDSFGLNVHIAGDILTVGGVDYQSASDPEGNATSRVYRYKLESNNTATLIQRITLQENAYDHSGEISFSQLGNRFVVGNYDYEGTGHKGNVSVFSIDQEKKITLVQTISGNDPYNSGYGRAIHQSGNLLAVGAYKEELQVDESTWRGYVGAVYIYKFDQNGTANLVQKVVPDDLVEKSKFGRSVLIKEDDNGTGKLLVGAYGQDSGVIYSYKISSEGLTEFAEKIIPAGAVDGDYFGYTQASIDEYVHVGAYKTGYLDLNKSGAFYTYKLSLTSGNSRKSIYNAVTQEAVSADLAAKSNTSPWSLLDSGRQEYSSFHHPAYYNSTLRQVLDSKEGFEVDGWVLTSFAVGAKQPYSEITDKNETQSDLVLYNQDSKQVITPEEVAKGSTDWLLLSPAKYPTKYTHPAYYNLEFHKVVENVAGDVENGWTLIEKSLVDSNSTNPALDKVLYNTQTHQVVTRTQIQSGGMNWMALPSGFTGNDGSTYSYPAYYNTSTHKVLDNSEGDQEDGWILTYPSLSVNLTSATGGTSSGGGDYSMHSDASLTATPAKGYVFAGWTGNASGMQNPLSINVTTDLVVVANFAKDTADDDSDGLSNYDELVTYDTNATSADSDGDGLTDADEINTGMNPKVSDKTSVDRITSIIGARGLKATPFATGWTYLPKRGWLYTNKNAYPYFYDAQTNSWMYFQSGNDIPRFYHYGSKAWLTIEAGE